MVEPDDGTVFLSNAGEPFSLDHLSDLVRVHVDAAQIGKRGASIRHLKQIHSATHPAQLPKKDGDAKPDEAAREELLNALAADQDEDEKQEP